MASPGSFSAGQVLTAAELNAIGTWQSHTVEVKQSSTLTTSTNFGFYVELNEFVIYRFYVVVSSTGSAGSELTVDLPVAISSSNSVMTGQGSIFDSSIGRQYIGSWFRDSSTTLDLSIDNGGRWGVDPNVAAASGDIIRGIVIYDVA